MKKQVNFFQKNLQIKDISKQLFLKKKFASKSKQIIENKKKQHKQKRLFSQISQNSKNSTDNVIKSLQNTLQQNIPSRKRFDSNKKQQDQYKCIYNKENSKKSKKTKKNKSQRRQKQNNTEHMIKHVSVNKVHFKSFFDETKNQDLSQNTKNTKESTSQSQKKVNDQIDKQIQNLKQTLKILNKKKQNNFFKEILNQKDLLRIIKVLNLYFREKIQNLDFQVNYTINQNVKNFKKTLISYDANCVNMSQKLEQNLLNVQNILIQDSITINSHQNSKQFIAPLLNSTQNISNVNYITQGPDNIMLNDSEIDLINDIKFNDDLISYKQSYNKTFSSSTKKNIQSNDNLLHQLLQEIREVKSLIEDKNQSKQKIVDQQQNTKPIQRPLIKIDFSKLNVFKKQFH